MSNFPDEMKAEDYVYELAVQRTFLARWDALDLGDLPFRYSVFRHTWPDESLDVYSIDIALKLSESNPLFSFSLSDGGQTLEKHKVFNADVDEAYALTTDLELPLLFVPLSDGTELCIDGHHRARKALLTGVDVLTCKVLSAEQAKKCLILQIGVERKKGVSART